ncbi:MAG TPA: UDP-N-acetylmuramoyl-tripeptide--D-alanyl-D-alanine ligase [Thermodesulfovibrionales bacterium]|nr:UDP-N-acetylmuramoyl-tripeptide--D-alanyl-D-alanine ligase [Thermodesulfovibrionales bacterium]
MATLSVHEILEATGGRLIHGNLDAVFSGLSTDSRIVRRGELFIPLKGDRFDGHDFLGDALRDGAGALVSAPPTEPAEGKVMILVENTLRALQDIARFIRTKSGITVIGVTGTNGKTTTKELIASILGISHRTLKSEGNLNNHIGLPLSLAKITPGDKFAVVEMGASMKGDIRELCQIAVPDLGVITNVGLGHLEGFGTIEGVRSTKLELFDAVKTIAVNADDSFLMEGVLEKEQGPERPAVITFGLSEGAGVSARDIALEERRSVFTLCTERGGCSGTTLPVSGLFNIYNALAAASVCFALGIAPADIKEGIECFPGVPMRLEVKDFSGVTVISDVYNANPVSMEEAVRELVRLRRGRAIAVLGDMLELGGYAESAHRRLGRWMAETAVDVFIAVGPLMEMAAAEFSRGRGRTLTVSDSSEAGSALHAVCREGDTLLVKGSRGMLMEKVFDGWEEGPTVPAGSGAGNAL